MIKILKLTSGEELITEVDEVENGYMITDPFRLLMMPPPNEGLQLIPWLFLAKDKKFHLMSQDVMLAYEPVTEIANAYRQQTGGVVAAPANALKDGKLVL